MVLGGAKGGKIEQGKSHIYIKNNNIIEKVATVKQSGTVSSVRSDRTNLFLPEKEHPPSKGYSGRLLVWNTNGRVVGAGCSFPIWIGHSALVLRPELQARTTRSGLSCLWQ